MGKDYIPRRDVSFCTWGLNFISAVNANAAAWQILQSDTEDLTNKFHAFNRYFDGEVSPHRRIEETAAKNEARAALERKVRGLVRFQLRNPLITDADRLMLGLTKLDRTYTRHKAPTSTPVLMIKSLNFMKVTLTFHDHDKPAGKAKPSGVAGALIVWKVMETPPVSQTELTEHGLATRSLYDMHFEANDRGKRVYFSACWQNRRGERGPWGNIFEAVVP